MHFLNPRPVIRDALQQIITSFFKEIPGRMIVGIGFDYRLKLYYGFTKSLIAIVVHVVPILVREIYDLRLFIQQCDVDKRKNDVVGDNVVGTLVVGLIVGLSVSELVGIIVGLTVGDTVG